GKQEHVNVKHHVKPPKQDTIRGLCFTRPVRPGTQQLCAILVATSEQAALGRVRAEAGEAAGGAASGKVSASKMFEAWTWVPSVEDVDATVDTAQDLELQAALLASLEAPEAVSHPVQELIAEKKCSKASKAGGR
ncbi:unnamed protein product, partial [Durusdinium trenchii]